MMSDVERYDGSHVHDWFYGFGDRPFRECNNCTAREFLPIECDSAH